MDRINHVKIVTPDPAAVDRFLREVVDIPAGWPLGPPAAGATKEVRSPAVDSEGRLTLESIGAFRGTPALGFEGGIITGSTESRQFQILKGDTPHIWAVAIGTRHLERAHERCVQRGIPCTEPAVTPWGDGKIHFFFAEVGGIVFEILRAESS